MIRSYASLLTWLGLTIVASLGLYHTSDKVNGLDRQLRALNAQIEDEQESLHVLRAEWVYLANPARVEAEVKGHLDLQPTDTRRVAALQNIGDLLPVQNGVEPVQPVMTAMAAPAPRRISATRVAKTEIPHTRFDRVIASLNAGHISDHMMMEHGGGAAPGSTDKLSAMIDTLGMTP